MVAIKDMKMPSCCFNCDMRIDGYSAGYYCAITNEELNDNSTLEHRPSDCPLMEIEERKVGKWGKSNIGGAKVCSICQAHMGLSNFKYCPNCGAEMRGVENELD